MVISMDVHRDLFRPYFLSCIVLTIRRHAGATHADLGLNASPCLGLGNAACDVGF